MIRSQKQPNCQSLRRLSATNGEAGFTIVELLVVLVILVLLASIVAPKVTGYLGASRTKSAVIQIDSLATALEQFNIAVGRYPTSNEGLEALVKPVGEIKGWDGPYINKGQLPLDPWGQVYKYESPGKQAPFDLFTYGRDGKEGGSDEDADIRH